MSKIYIVGSINMDLIINTDVMPEAGMTVTGYGVSFRDDEKVLELENGGGCVTW